MAWFAKITSVTTDVSGDFTDIDIYIWESISGWNTTKSFRLHRGEEMTNTEMKLRVEAYVQTVAKHLQQAQTLAGFIDQDISLNIT